MRSYFMLLDRASLTDISFARRRLYRNHPEVNFKPGPFYMGPGLLGWAANITCISWTLFVSVIFSLPTLLPVTSVNMNYASVITGGVVILSGYVESTCLLDSCGVVLIDHLSI